MSTLYLLNYNNYYNRIVKTTTLSNYKSNDYLLYIKTDYNFKPMDSCYTDIILNISDTLNPDYLVVTETSNGTESIASRWFILESSRTRGGQYKMRLRRDIFADYKSIVKASTIYCEKGYVADTDPLLFNSEGNTYNQIKTSEVLLKDSTNCAWIVGYCDYKLFEGVTHHSISVNATEPAWSEAFSSEAALLSAYPGSDMSAVWHGGKAENTEFWIGYSVAGSTANKNLILSPTQTRIEDTLTSYTMQVYNQTLLFNTAAVYAQDDEYMSGLVNTDKSYSSTNYENLLEANNKIVRVDTATPNVYKYYKLTMRMDTTLVANTITESGYPSVWSYLDNFLETCYAYNIVSSNYAQALLTARAVYILNRYTAVWEDITDSLTADIQDTVPRSSTAPYYMFVMPYFNCDFNDGSVLTANGAYTMPFVQSLIATVGTHVLDVQLLPYFPDQYLINAGVVMLDDADPKAVTFLVDSNNNKKSFIYWGAPQTFNVNLNKSISALPNKKVDNETRFCRLNAPNYSASFDFSIAKNNGVSYFHATCTYRPYQPHIQIIPEWGGIYGKYFPDGRGLICGGDYSVDIVNDAWTEYQINNKNYQLMFDRQIQTMDLQHDVQRMNEKFQVGANILSAAANGAMAGAGGGLPGMIAGATVGGVASAIGGGLDIYNNQRLRADQRSAAFDMFNYNLGNIQARPTTITKMSALVGNNKIWPFYEIYSATSREVGVLTLQLEYSGMTVGAIGTVKEFIGSSQTFIRGRLIRITGLEHDAEMSQLVADELARGIYIT